MSRLDAPSQNKWATVTDRKHVMTFGKYRGVVLADILEAEPQYIVWLSKNTDIDFHHTILEEAEEYAGQIKT